MDENQSLQPPQQEPKEQKEQQEQQPAIVMVVEQQQPTDRPLMSGGGPPPPAEEQPTAMTLPPLQLAVGGDEHPADQNEQPPMAPDPGLQPLANGGDQPADQSPISIRVGDTADQQNGPPPQPPPPTDGTERLASASPPLPMPSPPTPPLPPPGNNDGPPPPTMPPLEIVDGITDQYSTTTTTTTTVIMPNDLTINPVNEFAVDLFAPNATSTSPPSSTQYNSTSTKMALIEHGFAAGGHGGWNMTKTDSPMLIDENSDYDNFVKMDHAHLMWAKHNEHSHNVDTAWSGVVLGAAIANVLILGFLLILTRGKRGYFGIRLYTINLTIFAIVQIFLLAWAQPNDSFGLAKIASRSLRNFVNKYNAQLIEWSQIVFLGCTTVLILDSMQRYRGNGAGIGKLRWAMAIFILDAIPTAFIFVKGIWFEFVEIRPKPVAIYHAVALALFVLSATLLKLVVCCVPLIRLCCTRAPEEVAVEADRARAHALREKMMTNRLTASPLGMPPKPFPLSKLALVLLFVMITGWPQFTVFSLSMDLHPGGHFATHGFEKMSKHEHMHKLLQLISKEHLTHAVINIQQWSALARPFLETFSALFLLLIPSIGRKFQMRKIAPGQNANGHNGTFANANGNVNSDRLIAAGLFSRPMTASGRLAATAPPIAAVRM